MELAQKSLSAFLDSAKTKLCRNEFKLKHFILSLVMHEKNKFWYILELAPIRFEL